MQISSFDPILPAISYCGYQICKGYVSIYLDGIEVQNHIGYGIYYKSQYLGFRFTMKSAKQFVNHHDAYCIFA